MRLIHVTTILDFETSINEWGRWRGADPSKEILREFSGPALAEKKYVILSHCWGVAEKGEEEVTFQEMEQLLTTSEMRRDEIRWRTGYQKIIDTCKQAEKDGLEWVWIDTCCIDKKSSSELSEAINSMYQWYANADQCYVYLHDSTKSSWFYWDGINGATRSSAKWFTRGWTLQELIAPKIVHFFDSKWERIGDKKQFASDLSSLTRVPVLILEQGLHAVKRPSIAQIFSWAADRTTTREEDRAYSLLGLLGVHMPMLYGEGKHAFRRLQLEIIRTSNDQSIFAWGQNKDTGWSESLLADDPSYFRDCSDVISLTPDEFIHFLAKYRYIAEDELSQCPAERLRTFTVTNDGIQIWLPTVTFGPYAKVALACQNSSRWAVHPNCTTMNLAFFESGCFRFFGGHIPNSGPMEFKQHFLPYKNTTQHPSSFTFELDCQSLHGFESVEAKHKGSNSVTLTLSKDDDFATITYVHKEHKTYLAVVPIYFRGRGLVFITSSPKLFWVPHLRLRILKGLFLKSWKGKGYHGGHAHVPRSIQHVRAVYTEHSRVGCKVKIEVVRCPGCCPSRMELFTSLQEAPRLPIMNVCSELMVDLWKIRLNFCILVGWGPYQGEAIEAAIEFFMNMFGVSNFSNFIGEITFFKELSSIMPASDVSGRPRPRTGMDKALVAQEQRIEGLVKYLMQIDIEAQYSCLVQKKLPEEAMKWKPGPFATELLRVIGTAYENQKTPGKALNSTSARHVPGTVTHTHGVFYLDKYLCDLLKEIKKLQEILAGIDADPYVSNSNHDKRRALEEDIAGRILLTFWHGISSEVVYVLDRVSNRFLNVKEIALDLLQIRRFRLCNIGQILSQVASNSEDALHPLQRVMGDAADGVSKYKLIAELIDRAYNESY